MAVFAAAVAGVAAAVGAATDSLGLDLLERGRRLKKPKAMLRPDLPLELRALLLARLVDPALLALLARLLGLVRFRKGVQSRVQILGDLRQRRRAAAVGAAAGRRWRRVVRV
jgi:hypothetical protein